MRRDTLPFPPAAPRARGQARRDSPGWLGWTVAACAILAVVIAGTAFVLAAWP